MSKKRHVSPIILAIVIIAFLICYNLFVNFYNRKAEEQRLSITYCSQDEDCIMQKFNSYPCGGSWSACFNKMNEPRNDIIFKFQPRFGLHCDPNFNCQYPGLCECIEGRCSQKC